MSLWSYVPFIGGSSASAPAPASEPAAGGSGAPPEAASAGTATTPVASAAIAALKSPMSPSKDFQASYEQFKKLLFKDKLTELEQVELNGYKRQADGFFELIFVDAEAEKILEAIATRTVTKTEIAASMKAGGTKIESTSLLFDDTFFRKLMGSISRKSAFGVANSLIAKAWTKVKATSNPWQYQINGQLKHLKMLEVCLSFFLDGIKWDSRRSTMTDLAVSCVNIAYYQELIKAGFLAEFMRSQLWQKAILERSKGNPHPILNFLGALLLVPASTITTTTTVTTTSSSYLPSILGGVGSTTTTSTTSATSSGKEIITLSLKAWAEDLADAKAKFEDARIAFLTESFSNALSMLTALVLGNMEASSREEALKRGDYPYYFGLDRTNIGKAIAEILPLSILEDPHFIAAVKSSPAKGALLALLGKYEGLPKPALEHPAIKVDASAIDAWSAIYT